MSRSFRSQVVRTALAFALVFSALGLGQYAFLQYQLQRRDKDDLLASAEDLRAPITYADAWRLQGYRRSSEGPDIYLVLAGNGTLIGSCPARCWN